MKRFVISFLTGLFLILAPVLQGQENTIIIKTRDAKDTISRHIYGHFSEHLGRCIYDGIWVGEDSPIPNTNGYRNDILEALKEIQIPNLRWPGGCYADIYHWKEGIGPREDRPSILNRFWGQVVEDNSFGTHEFLNLCELLGAEPYLAVNVGSGTPEEAMDWVEYVNSDKGPMAELRKANGRQEPWNVKYWGIGNENWGCGGNMDAAYYADLFRRYASYCWVDNKIASGGLNFDLGWTETLMKKTKNYQHLIQGLSYHHYTVCHTWQSKGPATGFPEEDWFLTIEKNMEMEANLMDHMAIMDKYDPEKKVGLIADEWGNWHDSEPGSTPGFLYQQNTLRDAVTASIYLNVFNNHCDRVKMANIAQTVNVLQAMILTQDAKFVKTPSFYVFKMYNVHHDALMLPLSVEGTKYSLGEESIPCLSASASRNNSDEINISVTNVNPNVKAGTAITLDTEDKIVVTKTEIITADKMDALNDFDKPEQVKIAEFKDYKVKDNKILADLPAKSIVNFTLKTK